jgi:hypothetical protein
MFAKHVANFVIRCINSNTERCGQAVNTAALYSRGPWFKSRSRHRLTGLRFSRFSLVPPVKCKGSVLIRPRPLHSTAVTIHHSLIIFIWRYKVWVTEKASLDKLQINKMNRISGQFRGVLYVETVFMCQDNQVFKVKSCDIFKENYFLCFPCLTKYMLISCRNAGKKHSITIANRSFEGVPKLKYLGTTLTDQNCMQKEIQSRINSGNACSSFVRVWNLVSHIKGRA